ncbi:MAG: hypothetical protein DI619_05300 [Francisella sp.]|nr:MAG: hypothetical protein DI619_05300 [Francisella sp.]
MKMLRNALLPKSGKFLNSTLLREELNLNIPFKGRAKFKHIKTTTYEIKNTTYRLSYTPLSCTVK